MSKILYAASTMRHIRSFHLPYIEALRAAGHEVRILARGGGADYDVPFEKKIFSPKNAACRRRIREILCQERFDCILLNTTLCAFHVRLALGRKDRPRVVNFVHGYLFPERGHSLGAIAKRWAERLLRRRTDAVLVMNEEDRRIAEKYHLAPGVFFTRGMGVPRRSEVTPPEEIRHTYGEGRYAVAYVAELSKRKNQRLLIEAAALLADRLPELCLWLVGEGDERSALEARAQELGIADRVLFLGQRADACDIIRAADLYVSTSESEGLPFNIAEAMAEGKVIAASRVKGNEDLLADAGTGMLFRPGSVTAVADAILAAHDGIFRPDEAALATAYERYAFPTVYPETLAIMARAMEIAMPEETGGHGL